MSDDIRKRRELDDPFRYSLVCIGGSHDGKRYDAREIDYEYRFPVLTSPDVEYRPGCVLEDPGTYTFEIYRPQHLLSGPTTLLFLVYEQVTTLDALEMLFAGYRKQTDDLALRNEVDQLRKTNMRLNRRCSDLEHALTQNCHYEYGFNSGYRRAREAITGELKAEFAKKLAQYKAGTRKSIKSLILRARAIIETIGTPAAAGPDALRQADRWMAEFGGEPAVNSDGRTEYQKGGAI